VSAFDLRRQQLNGRCQRWHLLSRPKHRHSVSGVVIWCSSKGINT